MSGRDCHGHGTHVASLCGGVSVGVARQVTLYSVRVLACNNSAPWSVVLNGLDFVSRIIPERKRPAVVSMSLSGGHHPSVNRAVRRLYELGIPVVTAAGNGRGDSCSRSPASSPHAITVAGSANHDRLYYTGLGTNFGACVDVFAPGERVKGADYLCSDCNKVLSGTSMSAPLVAGVIAVYLSRQPLLTPDQLREKLVNDSVKDVLDFSNMPQKYREITPNRLVTLPGTFSLIL